MSQPFRFGGVPMPSLAMSEILKRGSSELTRYLGNDIYANPDTEYISRQRERMIATIRIHAARVGDRPTWLLRAPGRLNAFLEYMDLCKGDHISTTIDGDIPVAVSLRDDSTVTAVNAFPMYPPGEFSIPEEVARFRSAPMSGLPDDWGTRTRLHPHYGHPQGRWLNYVLSPFLRVASQLPDIRLRGVDMTFGPSSLPLRTGMSSSSAIIVLAFLALYLSNEDQLPEWSVGEVCGLLGEAEWYVGTRGGANDQTTILRNEPNGLLYNRHSRAPIESTPLPPIRGASIVIANSLWEVSPHLGASDIINLRKGWMMLANEMLASIIRAVRQHLDSGGGTDPGWLRGLLSQRPSGWSDASDKVPLLESVELWDRISARYAHLGSLVEDLLGIPDAAIDELIGLLPEEVTLDQAGGMLGRDLTGDYPQGIYRLRSASELFHRQNLIGRSIERILNEAEERFRAGEITVDSPEYDEYRRQIGSLMDGIQSALRDDLGVSNAQLDRLFEIARGGPGYLGGKLMGAGVGGYAAILVRTGDVEAFCSYMDRQFYGSPENFTEYREALDHLENAHGEGTPPHKAAVDMKINLLNAIRYPSEQRRPVTFSRGACILELDRFRD